MALDWKQQVTFDSVKKLVKLPGKGGDKGGGSTEYPSKTTMNLYQGDKSTTDVRKVVIVGVLLAVIIVLFVKFGVLDPLDALGRKQAELAQQEASLAAMKEGSSQYQEIKELYEGYMARYGGDQVDAISLLTMIEQLVMPRATVSSIVLADNTLTLTLYNVSLGTAGDIAKALEGQPSVKSVNITTATTQNADGQNTISTLVVALAGTESKEG